MKEWSLRWDRFGAAPGRLSSSARLCAFLRAAVMRPQKGKQLGQRKQHLGCLSWHNFNWPFDKSFTVYKRADRKRAEKGKGKAARSVEVISVCVCDTPPPAMSKCACQQKKTSLIAFARKWDTVKQKELLKKDLEEKERKQCDKLESTQRRNGNFPELAARKNKQSVLANKSILFFCYHNK